MTHLRRHTTPSPNTPELARTLPTHRIVVLILAAAAPLAAMVATIPPAFALGNGAAVPAMFVLAGFVLLCFATGYNALGDHARSGGGFYSCIRLGLGPRAGAAAGLVAALAYNTVTVGMLGAFAYFAQLVAASHGLVLPWVVWAAAGLALTATLGHRQVDLGARMLAVALCLEVAILLLLAAGVIRHKGTDALPAVAFTPQTLAAPGIGVTAMFVLICFIGVESAALYGTEAQDARRGVSRAIHIAVPLIAAFYGFISWIAVGAVGPDQLRQVASHELGNLFFRLSDNHLSTPLTTAMQTLLVLSLLAGMLALHNAASRYLFVLGNDGLLPRSLAAVHPRHRSPHRASHAQTLFNLAVCGVFALAGLDPYLSLTTAMLSLGTLGIIALQALACLGVLAHFRRSTARHWWRTTLAPAIGFTTLLGATILCLTNYPTLTGTTNPAVTTLPWLLPLAAATGLLLARKGSSTADPAAAEDPQDPTTTLDRPTGHMP
ncbi:APC family permease [Kitasatospora purpeofusca]|uniref:APC family permease n=1 Tax=Kitasatospora purpeofusca TaxID=67352 RepID=UPI003673BEED